MIVGLTFYMIKPFFSAMISALIVAMLFTPVYKWLFKGTRGRAGLSNGLTMIIVILSFIVPVIILTLLATVQLGELKDDFTNIVAENEVTIDLITENVNKVAERVPGIGTVTEHEVNGYINKGFTTGSKIFFDRILSLGATSVEAVVQFFVFFFMLMFMLPNIDRIRSFFTDLSPLSDELDQMYIERASNMVSSMLKGTLVIALIQTLLSVVFLYFAGVGYLLLLSIVLFVAAIIPFVGTMVIVVPIGILMIIAGDLEWGLFLIITNIIVVNSVDNVVRPMIVSGKTAMNSALILVSILGGLRLFGVFGFIYGPVIMILAITTIDVYKKYYRGKSIE